MSDTAASDVDSRAAIDRFRLWVEWPIAAWRGTDPEDPVVRWGPYVLVGAILGVFVYLPPVLRYLQTGGFALTQTPALALTPPTYLAIIWVARVLRGQYYQAVRPRLEEIQDPDREPVKAFIKNRYPEEVERIEAGETPSIPGANPEITAHITALWESDTDSDPSRSWANRLGLVPGPEAADRYGEIAPRWLRIVVIIMGLAVPGVWLLVDPNPMLNLRMTYGLEYAVVYNYVLTPLVLLPLAADLVTIFLGVTVLLPMKVVAADRIDFGDPTQFAGLRPVGAAIRNAGFAVAFFLGVFFLMEVVAPISDPFDPFSVLFLGVGGTAAIALFFGPVLYLHRFMKRKKDEKIKEITSLLAATGPAEEGEVFPHTMIGHVDAYDQEIYHEYTHLHIHLTRVENAKEYPVDAGIVAEFLFVLAIPFFAHVTWTFIFNVILH